MATSVNSKGSKRREGGKLFDNFSDFKVFLNQNDNERARITGTKKKIFKKKETKENVMG